MNVCGWLGLRRLLYNIIYINEEEREEKYADYDNNLRGPQPSANISVIIYMLITEGSTEVQKERRNYGNIVIIYIKFVYSIIHNNYLIIQIYLYINKFVYSPQIVT